MQREIRDLIEELFGISTFYPYQVDALEIISSGRNLVVSAPTASGKTLVGYMGIIKALLEGGRAFYLSPLKALTEEKYHELKRLEKYGFKVGISTGDYDSSGQELLKKDVVVCTYERFDSLLRHDPEWLSRIKCLVVDEIHMIGADKRGPTLEILLTKAITWGSPQIIGLSATIANGKEIAEWLRAEFIQSTSRPVKLFKGLFKNSTLILYEGSTVVDVKKFKEIEGMILNYISGKGQALVFVSSRKRAESYAERLSREVRRKISIREAMELLEYSRGIKEGGVAPSEEKLLKLISSGVAFHHAGLSPEARRSVEEAFRRGLLKVIVATPTLAAGCNLPARLVVIKEPYRWSSEGLSLLSNMELEQMMGRAGRPQYDPEGYAVIVVPSFMDLEEAYDQFILSPVEPVSSLLPDIRALRFHLLSLLSSREYDEKSLLGFFSNTFYGKKMPLDIIEGRLRSVLSFLSSAGFVTWEERIKATSLGERVSRLYIDPFSAKRFLDALQLKELTPIQILYAIASTPDMCEGRSYELSKRLEKVAHAFYSAFSEEIEELDIEDGGSMLYAYFAGILYDWITEAPESMIAEKWGIGLGDLRNFVETGEWLSYAFSEIAKKVKDKKAKEIKKITLRIRYGVKEELLPLVSIRGIGRVRGRILYDHGYHTPKDLLEADVDSLAKLPQFGKNLAKRILEEVKKVYGET